MYCKNCGKKIEDDAIFCKHCGAKVKSGDSKIKEVVDGEIHRCPNCGKELDAFVPICPSCGYELRGVKSGSKVEELSKKLENIDNIEKQKRLIANFYVPNTKEDLIEFFTLAFTQINDNTPLASVWRTKLDQTLIKAKLSLSKTDEYKYIINLYEENKRELMLKSEKERKTQKRANIIRFISHNFIWFIFGLVIIGGAVLIGMGIAKNDPNDGNDAGDMMMVFGILTALFGVLACVLYPLVFKKKK